MSKKKISVERKSTEKTSPEKKPMGLIGKIKSSKPAMVGAAFGAVVVVLLLVFGIFFAYAASYQNIFPGVSMNGIDVGGMSVDAAEAKFQNDFIPTLSGRNISVKCEGNVKEVTFEELNVNPDSRVMAEQAYEYGRTGNVWQKTFDMLGSMFGGKKLVADVEYDVEMFDSIIAELAGDKETKVKETEYTLDGNVLTITKGHGGRQVDRDKADMMLKEAIADASITELSFLIEDAKPQEVDVDEYYAMLTAPAKDAEYKKENGKIVIEKEKPGIIVDKNQLKKGFSSGKEQFTLNVQTVQPEVTADELSAMLFRDVMGTYSSNFASSSAARASNVELTANRINNVVLLPGEVFSYDQTVGSRTAANGYQSAGVYVGNRVESGIGGGICQTSSTLYSAVLYANLEIVERTSHSLPVSYVPGGMDATIAEGSIDFKFRNNTEYPVKIVATAANRHLECKILGVKTPGQTVEIVNTRTGDLASQVTRTTSASIPKGYKKIVSKGAPGYTVASQRIVKMNGQVVKTEKLTGSVYRATNTEEIVNPADSAVDSANLAVYTDGMVVEEEETADGGNGDTPPEGTDNGSEETAGSAESGQNPEDETTATGESDDE